jgi:chemotaxis protein methyltransferase CheR
MCIDDYLSKNPTPGVSMANFEFFATDISTRVLDIAQKGRYDKISILRGMNDEFREKYFRHTEAAWEISPEIKKKVKFQRLDLRESYDAFGTFDIIFCRYVLIYFSDALKKEIINKMHKSLADGGLIFTGNYVLYDMFKEHFDTKPYNNSTYFSKRKV